MSNLPQALRDELAAHFVLPALTPTVVAHSSDDTRKLLFELDARAAIEAVLIPDPPRLTLCISSQAGCGMACAFCATARLGLLRNLSATEIVGQVLAAQAQLRPGERITNVVFMGMGEPLANYDALVQAIEILSADWGVGLSARRITVSTVGLVPAMQQSGRRHQRQPGGVAERRRPTSSARGSCRSTSATRWRRSWRCAGRCRSRNAAASRSSTSCLPG